MRKVVSWSLLSLGIAVPTIVATSSCSLSNSQSLISAKNSSSNKPTIKKFEAVTMNEKRSRVIHCYGIGTTHFADVYFYYMQGQQFLKIKTYRSVPHNYFNETRPYVILKISSQDDREIFNLTIIGNKYLRSREYFFKLGEGYKVDFFHWEGDSRAELWNAEYTNDKFEDKELVGKSSNFSFLVSNSVESWQDHKFAIDNRYNTIFSNFGFIFLQKNFGMSLLDRVTKKKIATIFTSSFNGGCMYLLTNIKDSSSKREKLSYQDTSGNKYQFSFKQDGYYLIENLAKLGTDFNFSNIDDFELQSDQMEKVKYLLEMSNDSWFYLTSDEIWNIKNRQEYTLTEQEHVLMQYTFKELVDDNRYLRKNLLSTKYKRFYQWILSSKEALFNYLTAGHAQSRKIGCMDAYTFWIDIDNSSDAEWHAFEIWYDIWRNYPESSSGKYLRLAIAIAMELASGIDCWVSDEDENTSPLKRYELLVWLDSQGLYKSTPLENYSVQELRNIAGFKTGDEDLKWLYEYICKRLEKDLVYSFISAGHCLIDYSLWSIYGTVFSESTFYGSGRITFQRLIKYSGVCGAAGKISAIVANLFGIQAMAVGQTGHCACLCHKDKIPGYKIVYDVFGKEGTPCYTTWAQWMFADDKMHLFSRYFYDEFYAISNYIDGSLIRDEFETDKQKVIKNFYTLLEKNNKQLYISQKSQWGWVKRGQILSHFDKYDYLRKEIDSLKEETIQRIENIFEGYEENKENILNYYV